MLALAIVLGILAEGTPLLWNSHREVPKTMANISVGLNIGLDIGKNYKNWKCEALKYGIANGTVEIVKRVTNRTRPDMSDNKSFFSQHTMNSSLSRWNYSVSIPLAVITGYGQQAGGRHYFTDVLTGAVFGGLMSRMCH